MARSWQILGGPTLVLAALSALWGVAAEPPGADDWKYDVVYLKNGNSFKGMLIRQNAREVILKCISRKPGSPTVVYEDKIPREDVERLALLDRKDREVLDKRLQALKDQRELLAAQKRLLDPRARPEQHSGEAVTLSPAPWPGDPKVKGLAYHSTYFQLISDAHEDLIQLAAIQLEQVYAAYARTLPPRTSGQPTKIFLVRSLAEYQKLQKLLLDQKPSFANPAFYDATKNQVVCGSDLERMSAELEKIRSEHARLATELEERKAELQQAYRGKVPPELLAPIVYGQERIKTAEKGNARSFSQAKQRLFQRLYHEAFHAYLVAFVYPLHQGKVPVPHWLNEGLAQIFETAVFEVGELRIGHADKDRLKRIRAALGLKPPPPGPLLPLTELLKSQEGQFQFGHASPKQLSDRYYLASWALAFHLTFERKVLGSKAMDNYVAALKRGVDPLLAFTGLVGQPLPDFEKEYLDYLIRLREDGTASPKPRG